MINNILRPLLVADLPSLVTLEKMTQISPWSEEVFKQCFNADSIGWVIECSGVLIGFILILSQAKEAHILNLCVHPAYQRQGVGQQLLDYALIYAKQHQVGIAYLEVRISNEKAIKLYKKMGFTQVGERVDYYIVNQGRENALVFAKDLANQ